MELIGTFLVWVILIVGVRVLTNMMVNKNKKRGPKEMQHVQKHSRVSPAQTKITSGMDRLRYRATHEDSDYDDQMLDYCDSELPATSGITFKDMPAGTDELLYLRRYNRRREHQLEQALQSQENSIHVNRS